MRHAVMLFENTAQPDITRRLKVGAADPLTDQILRRFDAGIDVYESEAMTKAAVQKNRNRRQRIAVIARH